MKFSSKYPCIKKEDCFDPILITDTELFVDPFAVFEEKDNLFTNSFNKIIKFFNVAFVLAAKTPSRVGVLYKKLESMIAFPEVNEIGLGYSDSNTGAGAGGLYRKQIIDSIYQSIEKGMKEYRHFEEIGIFEKGIGCDRISDITCNILKEELIEYTQMICKKYKIPLTKVKMKHIKFDFTHLRWIDGYVDLPFNDIKKRGVLLVPARFLNDLPTINSDGFKDYIWDNKNDTLRNDLNYAIKSDIDKEEIIKIANKFPGWVKEYTELAEKAGYKAYDIKKDKKGVYIWANESISEHIKNNPIYFSSNDNFLKCTLEICNSFKRYIENEQGYLMLWDDERNKPKRELALQILFYGFLKAYALFLNFDITRESNAGSGPVDFKFSQGHIVRILLETKLVSNSKYWNGITKQLPKYLTAEGIERGIFILCAFTIEEMNKANELIDKVRRLNLTYDIDIIVLDATKEKVSASKL